jgi:similar to stage IV sporulation protein
MPLIRLWNFLRGYVIIKIVGGYGERLLNYAALKGIYLWDVRRIDEDVMIAKVSVRDFFGLSRLTRKTRCRLFVVRRAGFFFLIYRLKKRKALVLGAVMFIIVVYLLSSFIWNIEVVTEDPELRQAIRRDLAEWGLNEGVFKYHIDKKLYLDKIFSKYDDIAWAEIETRGTKVIIQLVKKQLPPELEENIPCDIIASKDGIVEEIVPLRGEPVVGPGDTVSTGDILIAGRVNISSDKIPNDENNTMNEILVHARGIVRARVWYQRAIRVPLIKIDNVHTGRAKRSFKFILGHKQYDFQFGKIPYDRYDVEITDQFIFPVLIKDFRIDVVTYKELEIQKKFLGVEGAVEEAEKQLLLQLQIFKDKELVQKKMEFVLDSEKKAIVGTLTLEVIEDIGEKRPIN